MQTLGAHCVDRITRQARVVLQLLFAAAAQTDVHVNLKGCAFVLQGANGTNSVLSCVWNKPATRLIVGSVDHNLRVFGLDAESTAS